MALTLANVHSDLLSEIDLIVKCLMCFFSVNHLWVDAVNSVYIQYLIPNDFSSLVKPASANRNPVLLSTAIDTTKNAKMCAVVLWTSDVIWFESADKYFRVNILGETDSQH